MNSGSLVSHPCYYPYKSAFYHLSKPQDVHLIWENESKGHLSLYLHVPFCKQRCLHCHRFSIANPDPFLVKSYLQTLRRQAAVYQKEISPESFEFFEIAGGMPTYLNVPQMETMFQAVVDGFGIDFKTTTVSCDVYPKGLTVEQLDLLKANQVDHVKVPIQSFHFEERRQLGVVVSEEAIRKSLLFIRNASFPEVTYELNYGIDAQTDESWARSVKEASLWNPTEIAIYPLHIERFSPFGQPPETPESQNVEKRLKMYRIARQILLQAGYSQLSSRRFCQNKQLETVQSVIVRHFAKGVIGLGSGARSYTKHWHYSLGDASDRQKSVSLLEKYVTMPKLDFKRIEFGFELNLEEQKRRFLIFSLLQTQGLSRTEYKRHFSKDVLEDFAEISKLHENGLAVINGESVILTEPGIERSDQIAPWLYSKHVNERIRLAAR